MNLEIKTFPCSHEGMMRYASSKAGKTAKGTVLLLPGWGEWIEKYSDVIKEWNERKFHVFILEWRGQGLSSRFLMDRKKTWLPSFDILVDDLDRIFKAELLETKKIILSGHSMGAHLGLRWYLERGRVHNSMKGVILASMLHAFKTAPFPLWLASMAVKSAAWLGFDQAYMFGQSDFNQAQDDFAANVLTSDEPRFRSMIAMLDEQPQLKVGGLTFGWLAAMLDSMERLEADLSRGAPRIPYYVFGSSNDPLVETSGFIHVASMLPNCMIRTFDGAKHELSHERDDIRNAVWAATDEFIASLRL